MSNITAKTSSNTFYKAHCEVPAHMGIKVLTVEELKEKLMQVGCYMASNIDELTSFIRKRYPGLANEEVDDLIKNKVFCCKL